ncbi:hypothetical protein DFH09DRAFT_1305031 [Mycena vulgaris]|nr:hypothetical protein DFH09DRAFT_1305031 [Mycena vulgaris]
MASLSPASTQSDPPVRVELRFIGLTEVPLLRGLKRSYLSIGIHSLDNYRLNLKSLQLTALNYTLPTLPLKLSTSVKVELRERDWLRSKVLATAQITVQDMLKMANGNNSISVPMKSIKCNLAPPSLSLSIRVNDMDIASALGQIPNLKREESDEPFQQVLRRLESLARFSSAIAQIHPISNAVYSLAKGIGQIVNARSALNDHLSKLVDRMRSLLQFVERAEAVSTIEKFPAVVNKILVCIASCLLLIHNRERANPGLLLISDDKSRVEKLHQELQDLELQMMQCITLGIADRETKLAEYRTAVANIHLLKLNPLSMEVVAPVFRTTCFPHTRSEVIKEITEWALLSSSNVLWMHAHAGSGKSTISTTMAGVFDQMRRLGSFVFFNRDVEQRSEPSGVIRTIAYQLGCHREDIAAGIRSCVEQNPRIIDQNLDIQFQRLLVEPLSKIMVDERLVIIIDALDEGANGRSQEAFAAFLALLSSGLSRLPNFVRVMITSRRYPRIERAFANMDGLQVVDLNQVAHINDDIRIYILKQMEEIQSEDSSLPPGWPGPGVVDALVQQSNGLFIWAAVACSYIQAYRPETRIQTLLSSPTVRARAEQTLDALYEIAIRDADAGSGAWFHDDFANDMHDVLAMIIVSQNPQSLQSINDMLGINNTAELVSRLQSVIKIDEDGLVHVIHPSVRDYLVDPNRCYSKHPWFINEAEEHNSMAIRSLRHLNKNLTRNMISLPKSSQTATSKAALPDAVTYASVSWIYHVCMLDPKAELADQIFSFLSKHFLHWVEALSILGRSRGAIDWLAQLQDWYSGPNTLPRFDPSFQALLYDGWRFAKAFSKTIESGPSLVYKTALPFCPKNTAISTMFNRDPAVSVVSGCLQHWSPSLMTLSGCSMQVATLSVSKSGDTIAAGCVDGHLKVWNARLGSEIFTIEGAETHVVDTYGLIYAQFTSDGTRLLCGMLKGDIYLLDADTGNIRTTLNVRDGGYGKKTKLYCVGLAPDDRTVVCGFQDGMIQIWDTESQVQLTPLWVGHDSGVNCVAFSHDQQKVISCSDDCTIHLWSPMGMHERIMLGHTESVHCVVFSPDDARIASASVDETMKIWDALTGSLLLTCRHSPDEAVYSVAFSNKGDRLATGTHHCKIRIWDSETGQEVMPPLSLHQGPIRALTFAPDDKTVISGSKDQHVRVWSLANMPPYASVQPCHTDEVNCVALSHDKTRFVSGARDNLVIVWNTMDGCAVFPPLQGHAEEVLSVDFSKDDTMIVSASKDGLICFWDAATGKSQGFPLILTEEIMLVKFSPSGSKIVVITKKNALAVWSIPDRSVLFGPLPYPTNCLWAAATFSHDDARLAVPYDHSAYPGDEDVQLGLGIAIFDAVQGTILFDWTIDTEVDGSDLYGVNTEYTADDRYVIMWYSVATTACEVVITRAIDATSGEECNCDSQIHKIPELKKPAAVLDRNRIVRNGEIIDVRDRTKDVAAFSRMTYLMRTFPDTLRTRVPLHRSLWYFTPSL